MGILDTLLSLIGLSGSSTADERDETTVSVEREGRTDTEAAVKGTDMASGVDADADATTGSVGNDAAAAPDAPVDAATETTDASVETDAGSPDADAQETQADAAGAEPTATTDDASAESVDVLKGIGPAYAERLSETGVDSVADLAAADAEELAAAIDLSPKRVGRWIDRAEDR